MPKLPYTPNSKIKHALRLLWLHSRERHAALKNMDYRCCICKVKQSVAKGREVRLEVHHMDGIDWDGLCDIVRRCMLPNPDRLAPMCKPCHEKYTDRQKAEKELLG